MTKCEEVDSLDDDCLEISRFSKHEEGPIFPYYYEKQQEKEKSSTPKRQSKKCILFGLSLSLFIATSAVSLQGPFFPQEAEQKGATPTQYGLVFGLFELVVVIMTPVYARLVPQFMTAKGLAVSGAVMEGLSCFLFGLLDLLPSGTVFIRMAFALRIVEGLSAAALWTGCFVILASEFPDTVATAFAKTEAAYGLGLIIGPLLGGVLYQLGGYFLPFAVCGSCLILIGLLLFFVLPKVDKFEIEQPRNVKAFLLNWDTVTFGMCVVTTSSYIGYNSATLEPHIRQFGLNPAVTGAIFVVCGGCYVITTPLYGAIFHKGANPHLVCVFGYFLCLISVLFIGPLPFIPLKTTLWMVILSLVISGIGMAGKNASGFLGMLKCTRDRGFPDNVATYSMVSAMFITAISTGEFLGPIIGGVMLDTVGYEKGTYFLFGTELIFLATTVIHVTILWHRNKTECQEKVPLLT